MILGILGIVALLEFIVMTIVSMAFGLSLLHRLADLNVPTPTPVVTGCPFGPDNCGG